MVTKGNLHAYTIATMSGTVSGIYSAGVYFDTWNNDDLNGNDAFILCDDVYVDGYENISSIYNWNEYGNLANMRHGEIQIELGKEWECISASGSTWSSLNTIDKKILSSYFLVDKDYRDEVHTDSEQGDNDHYILYHLLNKDAEERLGSYDMSITPKSIDYKKDLSQRLHPKFTFNDHGWLIEAEYFQDLVVGTNGYGFHVFTHSNPVIKYTADYIIDESNYVASRTIDRSWYLASGTYSTDTKKSFKIYEPLAARAEGRRRRKNLINRLLIDTVGLIVMTSPDLHDVLTAEEDAIPFMRDINSAISAYYESGTKKDNQGNNCRLIEEISTHTYERLDNWLPGTGDTVSIRMFVISRLDPQ